MTAAGLSGEEQDRKIVVIGLPLGEAGPPELSSLLASENVSTLILQERREAGLPFRIVLEQHAEHGDAPHALGLVWACRERPRGARTVWRAPRRVTASC